MSDELHGRRKRNPEAFGAGYFDVLDAVRSLGLAAELVWEGPLGLSIRISKADDHDLMLTDYWDPLPVTRAEQVGWTLSIIEGPVLSQCEWPVAEAAMQMVRSVKDDSAQRHSAA
jgi:hypothetical protein